MTPLSQSDLFPLISTLARKGHIIYSHHAKLRLNQPDRNMTEQRILHILKFPETLINTEYNVKKQEYTYVIRGYNKRHTVISLIHNHTYILLVTVY